MVIVNLKGGLGNQMFQYAFGFYLAQKHKTELKFDVSHLLDRSITHQKHVNRDFDLGIFGIDNPIATLKEISKLKNRIGVTVADKILNRTIGSKQSFVREPFYQFSPEAFAAKDNSYLDGFWQSEKYFEPVKNHIKKTFNVKEALLPNSEVLKGEISSCSSVCINIRRGDFAANSFHGTLPAIYYSNAEKIILKNVHKPSLYIFSDDLEWCKNNLKFTSKTIFVSHDYAGRKFQDYFRLMAACNHFIIPNSTFAWWAAYLAKKPDKIVITPRKWFNDPKWDTKDLLMAMWIKLDE